MKTSQSTRKTILIVDDEDIIRDLMTEVVAGEGYKVLTAVNGREAVDICKKQSSNIDLIILDMLMPEMDGKRTFEALRKISNGVKVLIATGFSQDEVVLSMLKNGANGVVNKPFHIEELLDTIASALRS